MDAVSEVLKEAICCLFASMFSVHRWSFTLCLPYLIQMTSILDFYILFKGLVDGWTMIKYTFITSHCINKLQICFQISSWAVHMLMSGNFLINTVLWRCHLKPIEDQIARTHLHQ